MFVKSKVVTMSKTKWVPFTTPDMSNPRHIKPQTHQTSDKEYRAANYRTDRNTFSYFKSKSDLFSSFQIGLQLKYEKVFLSIV